jgi:uncharacterized ferritin-like protein (DUF455 family)
LASDEAQVLNCCGHDELNFDLIRLCLNASYRSFADISVLFYRDWQTAKVKKIQKMINILKFLCVILSCSCANGLDLDASKSIE